jgi:nucleoside-triphosphatase THEP1
MGRVGTLHLLTGERGAGKTTLLQHLIRDCRSRNIEVAGVISPAVFENEKKTAINLQDVRSGELRRLAEIRRGDSAGVMTDHWAFDSQTLEWGNRILAALPACSLFLLDELGPIELERNQGLMEGLSAIARGNYSVAIVVIRPELVEKALQLWPIAEVHSIDTLDGRGYSGFFNEILARVNS